MPDFKERRPIYSGRSIDVGLERVRLPNGVDTELEIIRHPGGAAVVAVNERDEVCLLRQYRHAAGGWLWELPAGKIDAGEPPAETARRELAEEAGVVADDWTSLGVMVSSPGVFTEKVFLYLARGLTSTPTDVEFDEIIEVHWVDFEAAVGRALTASVRDDTAVWDAKSVIGLVRAQAFIQGRGKREA